MKRIDDTCGNIFSLNALHLGHAQPASADTEGQFQKENIYGVRSKELFVDASVVQGSHKTVFIAGMAAEDPTTGKITHLGDFTGQCDLAYDKIRKILKAQGSGMKDIVRIVAYVTDMRYFKEYMACQKKALAGAPLPPHSMIGVSQLA